jgi:hypothetical protein
LAIARERSVVVKSRRGQQRLGITAISISHKDIRIQRRETGECDRVFSLPGRAFVSVAKADLSRDVADDCTEDNEKMKGR